MSPEEFEAWLRGAHVRQARTIADYVERGEIINAVSRREIVAALRTLSTIVEGIDAELEP